MRAGMAQDREVRNMARAMIAELDGSLKQIRETLDQLLAAGSAWEDMKDSVENAYLYVKESLKKSSGGVVR